MRDPGWEERMSLGEELFDPPTIDYLERIGVAPGWHVLEVGAGRGSIAAWLAERVGPGGRAVATDTDTRDLEPLAGADLEMLRHDVLADDFPDASFDLVHCRGVLVHLSDPELALERMVRWLRPGGTLLTEEPWHDVCLLSPGPVVSRAPEGLWKNVGMDTGFARRMPEALRAAGLEGIEAEAKLTFFPGGSKLASYYRFILRGATVPLVASGELDRGEVERMTSRFDDPDWSDCGWPRIVGWGRKP
jgi:SAM-dependent methyltransferase